MSLDLPLQRLVDELCLAGRRSVDAGLVIGSGGNLSARDPDSGLVVATASGAWLDDLDESSFSVVDASGEVVDGHDSPTSELALHLACYRARPDAHAAIHLHPQMCVLLDAIGEEIRLLTTDHTYYVRDVASVPYLPPGGDEVAEASAAALADGTDCCVLGHHGCITLGSDVGLAFRRAANLEEASRLTYRAIQLGDPDTSCPPAYRERIEMLEAGGDVGTH